MSRSWSRSCATGSPPRHDGHLVKIAIILFNLGGPDSLDAVQPFLRNLFGDPAILRLPSLIRRPLASFLARRRTPKARGDLRQDRRLLADPRPDRGAGAGAGRGAGQGDGRHEWRGYVCMRYWHPMTEAVVRSVERFAPDRIVLLPLYPQFSTTTTASSFKAWNEAATFKVPTTVGEGLSDRAGLHRRVGRAGEAGPGRGRRRAQARAVLRARPARKDDQGGRSLSGARSSRRRRPSPSVSAASTGRSAIKAASAR